MRYVQRKGEERKFKTGRSPCYDEFGFMQEEKERTKRWRET
jgi:hypothetical protein